MRVSSIVASGGGLVCSREGHVGSVAEINLSGEVSSSEPQSSWPGTSDSERRRLASPQTLQLRLSGLRGDRSPPPQPGEDGSFFFFSLSLDEHYFQLFRIVFSRILDSSSCSFHETVNINQKIWLTSPAAGSHLGCSFSFPFLTELYLHSNCQ